MSPGQHPDDVTVEKFGSTMQVTEVKSEGLSREFKIALPAQEIESKVVDKLSEIAKTAQMPGFRPGKVPVSLLKKRYGSAVMGEVLEEAVSSSAQKAMEEKGVRPAGQPQFDVSSFEDGKDFEYSMSFDILPEIKIPELGKIELERLVPDIDEKTVDDALERIADANKTSEPIKRKRKSKSGDIVSIDFVGKIGDEPFPGGAAEGYELELGSGSFIPGFEDQLIGVNAGDDIEVKVAFPEEYGAEELAGKDAVFEVKLHEIREAKASPIDDDLAMKAGAENLDKLKEMIREEQSREFKEYGRMLVKRRLLDQLAEQVSFEIPPKLAEQEYTSILHQWQHEQHGSDPSHGDGKDHEEAHKIEPDADQKAEFEEIAARRIRLGLLLSEIGRENNIQLGQDDITRAMMAEARKYQGQEQQVLDFLKSNPQAMEQVSAPAYEDKIVDFILEMVKVNETPASVEDLMKALEEADSDDQAEKKAPAKKKKPAAKKKAASDEAAEPAKKPAAKKKAPAKKKADDAE